MVQLQIWLLGTELLAGIKLDEFATSLSSFFDRLKDAETIEGVRLGADSKTGNFGIVRNWGSGSHGNGAGNASAGQSQKEPFALVIGHHRNWDDGGRLICVGPGQPVH